jgi:guanine deaminase
MLKDIVRGPLLIPGEDGSCAFHFDGALAADARGVLQFAGAFAELQRHLSDQPIRRSDGVMLPPLLDVHIHVPQHPIRGRFTEGVAADAPEGKLLAGLNRNVFPAEAKCAEAEYAEQVVRNFLADTLSHGVVGGATYVTPSVTATEIALTILPPSWSVGLVLMNQNCPANLRTDETNLEADVERLAKAFGRRLIITDRFAVAVKSPLRQRASALAEKFGLRTQTHLNEQVAEKAMVEKKLYPQYASYTDVYLKDGLLNHQCIAAHCIQMTDDEWRILRDTNSSIAHCPTSNLLLESGVMPLDEVLRWRIPYALATDVGASPTVSMLAEMARLLQVHRKTSSRATAVEALYRSTRASADLLGLSEQCGRLEVGSPMSFIEVDSSSTSPDLSADEAIRALLPHDLDHPSASVARVNIAGQTVFQRSGNDA